MKKPEVCAQLFTVRDGCQNEKDYAESLMRVAGMGFKTVQVSGGMKLPYEVLRGMLDAAGLRAVCAHEPLERFRDEPEKLAGDMKTLGCAYAGVGMLPLDYCGDGQKLGEFIEMMNRAAKVFAAAGLTLTYHNHCQEFTVLGGRRIMDILIEDLDPTIQLLADIYWLQYAGIDAHDFLRKLPGRFELVHFKDMTMVEPFRQDTAEIGLGNMNIRRTLQACAAVGTQYLFIEQDNSRIGSFESLRISRENLLLLTDEIYSRD